MGSVGYTPQWACEFCWLFMHSYIAKYILYAAASDWLEGMPANDGFDHTHSHFNTQNNFFLGGTTISPLVGQYIDVEPEEEELYNDEGDTMICGQGKDILCMLKLFTNRNILTYNTNTWQDPCMRLVSKCGQHLKCLTLFLLLCYCLQPRQCCLSLCCLCQVILAHQAMGGLQIHFYQCLKILPLINYKHVGSHLWQWSAMVIAWSILCHESLHLLVVLCLIYLYRSKAVLPTHLQIIKPTVEGHVYLYLNHLSSTLNSHKHHHKYHQHQPGALPAIISIPPRCQIHNISCDLEKMESIGQSYAKIMNQGWGCWQKRANNFGQEQHMASARYHCTGHSQPQWFSKHRGVITNC